MQNDIQKGDVIYVNRGLYRHYGVYVGNGRVVHFAAKEGDERKFENAIISEVSIDLFLKGGECKIQKFSGACFLPEETVSRAKSWVGYGKGTYNLIKFNCEDFAVWCKTGKLKSSQVNKALGILAAGAAGIGLIAFLHHLLGDDKKDK